ncbi:MAG: hypothetical protein HWD63_10555 [Candidatus Parvibacillus calidus]|nr:MAG: hypothetical protein HWD63_10555 [Candidatus Parvibacillus calidus]
MFRLFIAMFFFVAFSYGCVQPDTNVEVTPKMITGTWILDSALRDGTPTESLDGLFILLNKKVVSNITGDTNETMFEIQGSKIVHLNDDSMVYQIQTLNDSILKVSSNIRNIPFELKFRKFDSTTSTDEHGDLQESDGLK